MRVFRFPLLISAENSSQTLCTLCFASPLLNDLVLLLLPKSSLVYQFEQFSLLLCFSSPVSLEVFSHGVILLRLFPFQKNLHILSPSVSSLVFYSKLVLEFGGASTL